MNKAYADTVRLLLTVAPEIFRSDIFAMKGGTAINLFVRDMPRLSVDIDVAYTSWETPRDAALKAISDEIGTIAKRLRGMRLEVKTTSASDIGDSKLLVSNTQVQVKVEINLVFRGTVLPVEKRPLSARTAEMFSVELSVPTLAVAELYGSKIVAALDRQHPRDLFDVAQMYEADGLTERTVECFVTYLAGHNRPMHEVLFAMPKDIAHEYQSTFVGMTRESVTLETLLQARARLFGELPTRISDKHKTFLVGLARAAPDWSLLECKHAKNLPAIRWRIENLEKFRTANAAEFERQAKELEDRLRG
ncbi:MAG: nucleotidyl transferase AbiEii/AbiGii toxin family protein [Planctomycetota bacterium]|nr:nucleotidyl transferase AbiEii/AbiGii toxin family protein [Planctomycetota bacterium]